MDDWRKCYKWELVYVMYVIRVACVWVSVGIHVQWMCFSLVNYYLCICHFMFVLFLDIMLTKSTVTREWNWMKDVWSLSCDVILNEFGLSKTLNVVSSLQFTDFIHLSVGYPVLPSLCNPCCWSRFPRGLVPVTQTWIYEPVYYLNSLVLNAQ